MTINDFQRQQDGALQHYWVVPVNNSINRYYHESNQALTPQKRFKAAYSLYRFVMSMTTKR